MPDSWPIAVAIIVAVAALWDWARKDLQLAHGRMLSADKSQTFERAITALDLKQKSMATNVQKHVESADVRMGQTDNIITDVYKRIAAVEAELLNFASWQVRANATFEKLSADIDTRDRAITNVAEELVVLKQQQTMALAGVANLPKHGFAGRPK